MPCCDFSVKVQHAKSSTEGTCKIHTPISNETPFMAEIAGTKPPTWGREWTWQMLWFDPLLVHWIQWYVLPGFATTSLDTWFDSRYQFWAIVSHVFVVVLPHVFPQPPATNAMNMQSQSQRLPVQTQWTNNRNGTLKKQSNLPTRSHDNPLKSTCQETVNFDGEMATMIDPNQLRMDAIARDRLQHFEDKQVRVSDLQTQTQFPCLNLWVWTNKNGAVEISSVGLSEGPLPQNCRQCTAAGLLLEFAHGFFWSGFFHHSIAVIGKRMLCRRSLKHLTKFRATSSCDMWNSVDQMLRGVVFVLMLWIGFDFACLCMFVCWRLFFCFVSLVCFGVSGNRGPPRGWARPWDQSLRLF